MTQAKRSTYRFFTKSGKYMGWGYIKTLKPHIIKNWLQSGNTIKIEWFSFYSGRSNSSFQRTYIEIIKCIDDRGYV